MAYTLSERFSNTGAGTLLAATYWVPAIEQDFPLYTFWSQFLTETWGGAQVMGAGFGELFKVSYVDELAVATTALTAGTAIASIAGTGLTQVTGTLKEYGNAETITSFAEWVSNIDMQKASGVTLAANAFKTRDMLIGSACLGVSTAHFEVTGTDAANVTLNGTTANGTSAILPGHVTKIATRLRALGVPPMADGLYRWVGRPGAFDEIKSQTQVYSSAASLGLPEVYTSGDLFKFGGFLFIEEAGAQKISTNAANGVSYILGKNPVVGYDNFMRPDLIRYYADSENDFGRSMKIGWYGVAGYKVAISGPANSRVWKVYSNTAL